MFGKERAGPRYRTLVLKQGPEDKLGGGSGAKNIACTFTYTHTQTHIHAHARTEREPEREKARDRALVLSLGREKQRRRQLCDCAHIRQKCQIAGNKE